MNSLIFEGIAFNADMASKISEQQFMKEQAHVGLNEEQLKTVYGLTVNAVKQAPKVEAPKPDVKFIKADGQVADEKELAAMTGKPKPIEQPK